MPFTAFFERKSRASTIQSTVGNEGDAVDIKGDDNNGNANVVEAKVINNSHAKQEATTDEVGLPPTAK
ncbi:hypothetical protein MAM1_0120c05823 [Mucor ambiguus]|uniref:Uncharacterized protein n=1 Tax=Mucor ambiguus TaxID=91626 RepID=A0A0C9M7Y6_9FUNG|nr:hypothetical protein MAM1_0120c05823 [Mucor ambiguus]